MYDNVIDNVYSYLPGNLAEQAYLKGLLQEAGFSWSENGTSFEKALKGHARGDLVWTELQKLGETESIPSVPVGENIFQTKLKQDASSLQIILNKNLIIFKETWDQIEQVVLEAFNRAGFSQDYSDMNIKPATRPIFREVIGAPVFVLTVYFKDFD